MDTDKSINEADILVAAKELVAEANSKFTTKFEIGDVSIMCLLSEHEVVWEARLPGPRLLIVQKTNSTPIEVLNKLKEKISKID